MVGVPLSRCLFFVQVFMLSGAWYPSKFTRSVDRSPLIDQAFFFLRSFVEEVIVIFLELFYISSRKDVVTKFINRKGLLKADLPVSAISYNM